MYTSEGQFDIKKLFDRINIPVGSKIIDFGCGTGYYSKYAADLVGTTGKVLSVDKNSDFLNLLIGEIETEGIKNLEPVCADLLDLKDIKNNYADFGLLINLFHGIYAKNAIEEVFHEIRRVMKFESKIAIVDFRTDAPVEFPEKKIRCSLRQIKEKLEPLCFKIKDHVYLNEIYQLVVIKKK